MVFGNVSIHDAAEFVIEEGFLLQRHPDAPHARSPLADCHAARRGSYFERCITFLGMAPISANETSECVRVNAYSWPQCSHPGSRPRMPESGGLPIFAKVRFACNLRHCVPVVDLHLPGL